MKYKIIIPARGASKRYNNKNITNLNGIPLIAHSIIFAKQIDFISDSDIWVNTDDEKISNIASNYNCQVFKRSSKLGGDNVPTSNVIKEHVEALIKDNVSFDAVILLQPTNPLRNLDSINRAVKLFEKFDRSSLASFSSLHKKIGSINNNYFKPSNYKFGQRSQDLENYYFENGSLYITKVNTILEGKIISNNVYPMIDNHYYNNIDIDYEEDLLFAEFVLQKTNNF